MKNTIEQDKDRLKELYELFDDAQRADFIRRWDVASAVPSYISILDRDIAHLEKLIEKQSTQINKYTIWGFAVLAVIAAGNWFVTGSFDYPDWAKGILYIAVGMYIYVLIITAPANQELLNTANKNRQRYLYEAESVGVNPQLMNRICSLLSLKHFTNTEPVPDDLDEQIESVKNATAFEIVESVLREPKNLYFNWTNY
jgi:hypothetical protein